MSELIEAIRVAIAQGATARLGPQIPLVGAPPRPVPMVRRKQ